MASTTPRKGTPPGTKRVVKPKQNGAATSKIDKEGLSAVAAPESEVEITTSEIDGVELASTTDTPVVAPEDTATEPVAPETGEEKDYDFDYAEQTLPEDASPEQLAEVGPRRRRDLSGDAFVRWLRGITPEQWAYVGIVLLGIFLRFWALGDKPLHHDESLHAYFSWTFWKDPGSYTYDPLLHGPFQFHIIPLFYTLGHLLGLAGGGANDYTVRILPALLGAGMVPLPYWLRNWLGRWGALSAAFILAVSPTFVYYSRFVRDDIYVTFFTLLLAVAVLQYSYTRRAGWLFLGVAALTLSYTAMENTFFTIAVFGSYLIAVVLWDVSPAVGRLFGRMFAERDQPLAGRLIVLVPFACIMGVVALFGLHALGQLSNTINSLAATHANPSDPLNPDVTIQGYETRAVGILLIGSILISAAVIVALLVQTIKNPDAGLIPQGVPRWRRWLNPRTQPALDTLLSTHWIQWFMCFVIAWVIFAVFFWKIPEHATSLAEWGQGFQSGIGRGLLQGIYYWLEQQHVARGNQPWYYYFILIPLYEPLILVFSLAGVVRALIQPTRFRLFLVYWFVVNLALYSWAGEKMPWLVIHIVLPMILLSGVAFEWVFQTVIKGAQKWWQPARVLVATSAVAVVVALAAVSVAQAMAFALICGVLAIVGIGAAVVVEQWARYQAVRRVTQGDGLSLVPAPRWAFAMNQSIAAGSLLLALVLLVPTVWNMQRVSFYEPSVAPNEMLIYVQTTTDVTNTIAKIAALDKLVDGGKKTLHIGVTSQAEWPFVWYLKDYTNISYGYTPGTGTAQPDVILSESEDTPSITSAFTQGQYATHHYRLRWWWDESYKLPGCTKTKTSACTTPATWDSGDGPFLWLSYGTTPPAGCKDLTKPACDPMNAPFNGADAAQRYWNWLWLRQNISGTQPGSTDFDLFISSQDVSRYHISP